MMEDYFKRFKDLEYQKDPNLKVEIPKRILWVDEDMLEDSVLGDSMKKTLEMIGVIPKSVSITYSGQEKALEELLGNPYSMVILDNDAYRGEVQGIKTLKEIKKVDPVIPVVYTAVDPREIKDSFVSKNVAEIVAIHEIPMKFIFLIKKYIKGV